MSGGTLVIDAGGDGFDSNGSATVTGGLLVVNGPTRTATAPSTSTAPSSSRTRTLVAAGTPGWPRRPDAASEAGDPEHDLFNDVQPAGTVVRVQAADGTGVADLRDVQDFQSLVVSHARAGRGRDLRGAHRRHRHRRRASAACSSTRPGRGGTSVGTLTAT